MSVVARKLTYDDLRQMPDDGKRYEIIDGELLVAPSPFRPHQRCAYVLARLIGDQVDADGLGEVYFAPVDVRLSPHDVVQPDLLFIRQDRLAIYKRRGDVEGAPDLVVEIMSESSEKIDSGRKYDLYEAAGVREYWLVYPERRRFQLFVLKEGRYVEVSPDAGVYRSEVIPGLSVDPDSLLDGLDYS